MRVHVTRDDFNQLIDDLMPRVATPLVQAPKMAGLQLDQVDQVVLLGAGTRVSKVQEEIQKRIGSKELGRFLNTDEAIAAHLSKGSKVKPSGVEEQVGVKYSSPLSRQRETLFPGPTTDAINGMLKA
ncbi:hypothetical protein TELCIR_04182 [Teladorsagia circumcincta]|uniref:Hypoxia up-regulated protein 1 n=1 Tax=Teladorsagia circumcincta TaxID=45464 RepID=A0A2G9UU94_TELCI|nr:hypothetical protein TELCIR_04182 [Teladorsagia circumcincta]